MVARLQRFYGGPPLDWWRLPSRLLAGYIEAMPGLDADERLQHHGVVAAANGNYSKADAEAMMRSLRKLAETVHGKQRARKATLDDLRGMGIEIEEAG